MKIDRFIQTPVSKPAAPPAPAPEPPAAGPAMAGDRFVSSGQAERLRALRGEIAQVLEVVPRTSSQAEAWIARGLSLKDQAEPLLHNGALKALPLKERAEFAIAVRRLDAMLEQAPRIARFIAGD